MVRARRRIRMRNCRMPSAPARCGLSGARTRTARRCGSRMSRQIYTSRTPTAAKEAAAQWAGCRGLSSSRSAGTRCSAACGKRTTRTATWPAGSRTTQTESGTTSAPRGCRFPRHRSRETRASSSRSRTKRRCVRCTGGLGISVRTGSGRSPTPSRSTRRSMSS